MPRQVAYLTPEGQAVVDLAKRMTGTSGPLTPEILMAAACNHPDLKDLAGRFVPFLPDPDPKLEIVPTDVPIAEGLRPTLAALSQSWDVGVREMLASVARSNAGRAYLLEHGMSEADLAAAVQDLVAGVHKSWRNSSRRREVIERLSAFGRVLTEGEPPRKGELKVERYLWALQTHLMKMRRPSVIVIGQPGTGKTALVYEFARRLVEADDAIVPGLRDKDVFELSPSFLRAGASLVGEYDSRVSALLSVLEASPNVILFVDEVHTLLSSAMHERSAFSEANEAFKNAVERGTFSLVGATTLSEYRHYIAPDGALARRFGLIRIESPTVDETVDILKTRAEQFRRHYAPLRIPDAALVSAVEISEDLLPDRFQPDKSLELLDEACALSMMTTPPIEEVTDEVLLQAVEGALGHSVVRPAMLTEATVLEKLEERIVGQDDALREIARAFVAGMSKDWLEHDGPRRAFFFCGPTGVGKTETARLLAQILGGGRREAMLRVDCNTLQGSPSEGAGPIMSRLLGVAPGYVGYSRGEGGMLSRVRDTPECVVLFDEIEKASVAISRLLLQILDEGQVQDTDGNLLDFRRAFIVFTTNAGTTYDAGRHLGFADRSGVNVGRAGEAPPIATLEAVKSDLLARGYGEEFLGRNLDFVMFDPLKREDITIVLNRQLDDLRSSAELRGYALSWDHQVFDHLLAEWTPRFGARWVLAILRNRIVEQLAIADAQGELDGITQIRLEKDLDARGAAVGRRIAGVAGRRKDGQTLTVMVM